MKKIIFLFLLIILIISFFLYSLASIYLPKHSFPGQEKIIDIEKGKGSKEIATLLKKEGVIRSEIFFLFYASLRGQIRQLQSGSYAFNTSMNIPQIIERLVKGDIIKEKITIIEGWNLRDVGFYLENLGMFQAEELWELVGFPGVNYLKVNDLPLPKDFSAKYNFLADKPKEAPLEGYLFPDTYEVVKGETLDIIVSKMLGNFGSKLKEEMREEIKRQGKSIFEIVTMASLLEKEVKTPEDKKIISGILWKRLEVGMPLQVDATISYITGKRTTKILIEETQIDSPYNTYKKRGLPLGPISNPGIDSISAAIYPQKSDYWYYLSTPEGETIFSKTLNGHNSAKVKYLK